MTGPVVMVAANTTDSSLGAHSNKALGLSSGAEGAGTIVREAKVDTSDATAGLDAGGGGGGASGTGSGASQVSVSKSSRTSQVNALDESVVHLTESVKWSSSSVWKTSDRPRRQLSVLIAPLPEPFPGRVRLRSRSAPSLAARE